ncbi:hypothetical protein ACO3VM_04090 [Methanocaldococcus sp. 10A]
MKRFMLILLLLLFLSSIFGYYFGYIKVNEESPSYKKEFDINKVENYTYKLYFIHYGNIKENMKVNIHLNGNLIYTIDDANDGSGHYKKETVVDITDYLKDGKNVLKVEGIHINGNETYHPYYVLDNVYINEPTKSLISFKCGVLTLILMGFIIIFYYEKKSNRV